MTFTVSRVADADMDEVVNVMFTTFTGLHSQPAIDGSYPAHSTAEGRSQAAERLRKRNSADPMVQHMKVVDDDTGRVVAQGTFFMRMPGMKHAEINLQGPYWSKEEDREWAEELLRTYFKRRFCVFEETEGPVFAISAMSTLPEYHGRGAGSAFMRWGTDQADSCGAECVVESAIGAEGFYEKHGFIRQEFVNLTEEMPRPWPGRPEQCYTWMRRPAPSKRN